MPIDWEPIWLTLWLTLRLAGVTTILLLLIGIPLASWLSISRFWLKPAIEAIISYRWCYPPSVVGFYLLLLFSPTSAVGAWLLNHLSIQLVFSV